MGEVGGQGAVADLPQVILAHEEVPAVADMGLFGVEQVGLPLRLVGVAQQQVIDAALGVAGESGTGIEQLYPDPEATEETPESEAADPADAATPESEAAADDEL